MQDEYSTPQSPAAQLWKALASLFGADALKRKFGPTPPEAWHRALSDLAPQQLRYGLSALLKAGSEHIPSLPSFLASCRSAREFEPSAVPQLSAPLWDAWDAAANRHLLAYALRIASQGKFLDRQASQELWQSARTWAEDMRADAEAGAVPVEQQRAAWQEIVGAALARCFTVPRPQTTPDGLDAGR